jgi:hypothetical protein
MIKIDNKVWKIKLKVRQKAGKREGPARLERK